MWLPMYVLLAYILATTVATEVQPSIITTQNNDYFGYMDKFTGFSCEANGSNLKYTWKHNDILVTKKYILKFPTVNASVLQPIAKNLNLDYEGAYQCFAENSIGRILGRKAVVKFTAVGKFKLPKTVTTFQNVTVGLTFALHCPEHGYSYNVKYNWQYQEGGFGVTLPSDPHYFVTKSGTLHFATVTEADINWINSKGGIQCTQIADVQKQTRSSVSHKIMLRVDARRPVVVNKLVKPEIMTGTQTWSVLFGFKNVYFECGAIGNPVPTLKWFKLDGITFERTEIKNGSGYNLQSFNQNLRISEVNSNKAREYLICQATNSQGKDVTTGRIFVSNRLQWRVGEELTDQEPLGGKFVWECGSLGGPTYNWYKNGKPIQRFSSGKMRIRYIDGRSQLIFDNITKDDNGMYQCTAANEKDIIYSTGRLQVKANEKDVIYSTGRLQVKDKKPEFTEDMGPVTLIERTTGVISCPVRGSPLPTITWRKNSLKLQYNDHIKLADNKVDLLIVNITKADQGIYVCHAGNSLGTAEDSSNVTVVGKKPEFTEDMGPVTLIEGRTGVISCPVDALPLPTITWRKNSLKLQYNDHIKLADNKVDLVIVKITKADQGIYVCHAENSLGTAEDSSNVTVGGKKPKFTEDMGPVTLIEGRTGVISCPVDALPLPTITWRKNSLKLQYNDRIKLADNKVDLVIVNITKADQGIYVCHAENSLGTAADSSFVVVEGKKPKFTEDMGPVTFIEGRTGVISCPVDALPLPTITWRKNSLKLQYNDRIKLADNKVDLVIVNITKADQGIYVCHAENSLGTAADSSFVVVGGKKPEFTEDMGPVTLIEGRTGVISCPVDALPLPTITWRKNFLKLRYSDRVKLADNKVDLVIVNITKADQGIYVCHAENSLGTAADSSFVVVGGKKPEFTEDMGPVTLIEGRTGVISCPVDALPLPTITWRKNFLKLRYSDRVKLADNKVDLVIVNITKADQGIYVCHAENSLGTAADSSFVVVEEYVATGGNFRPSSSRIILTILLYIFVICSTL